MMKKKISLFLTALLAVVMLGGMTSCNSDDNEETCRTWSVTNVKLNRA